MQPHALVGTTPGHGVMISRVGVPGVADVDSAAIIAKTNDCAAFEVEHHRAPGIDLSLISG